MLRDGTGIVRTVNSGTIFIFSGVPGVSLGVCLWGVGLGSLGVRPWGCVPRGYPRGCVPGGVSLSLGHAVTTGYLNVWICKCQGHITPLFKCVGIRLDGVVIQGTSFSHVTSDERSVRCAN